METIYLYSTPSSTGYWYYSLMDKNDERAALINHLYDKEGGDKDMIGYLKGFQDEDIIYRRPAY